MATSEATPVVALVLTIVLLLVSFVRGEAASCTMRSSFGYLHVPPPPHAMLVDAEATTMLPFIKLTVTTGNETESVRALIDINSNLTLTPTANCFRQVESADRCTGTQGATAPVSIDARASDGATTTRVTFADGSVLEGPRLANSPVTVVRETSLTLSTPMMMVTRVNGAARHSGVQAITVLGLGPRSALPPFAFAMTRSADGTSTCDVKFTPPPLPNHVVIADGSRGASPSYSLHGAAFTFGSSVLSPSERVVVLDTTYDGVVMHVRDAAVYLRGIAQVYDLVASCMDVSSCPLLRSGFGEGRYRVTSQALFAPLKHALGLRFSFPGEPPSQLATLLSTESLFERLPCAKDAVTSAADAIASALSDCVALKLVTTVDEAAPARCGLPCLESLGEVHFDPSLGTVTVNGDALARPFAGLPASPPPAFVAVPVTLKPAPRVAEPGSVLHRAEDKVVILAAEGEAWTAQNGLVLAFLSIVAFVALYVWWEVRSRRHEVVTFARTSSRPRDW